MAAAMVGKTLLDSAWLAARSTEVEATGVLLTTTMQPSGPSPPWVEAAIPGTVLGTLLKNKLVPDPFYGLNNESIVDIADSGREYYTFWFFTTFESKLKGSQYIDLNFRAINYSGEVYLNGHQKILPKGMFRRHSLDITDIINREGKNLLAVLIHPPDHPGTIPPEGGQGGDHEIGKDVAAQYVEGWDWMTPIRDRNTGIWDEVSISVTGPVKLDDPHLVSSFFDDYERSYLHTTVDLENKSSLPAECSLTIQVTAELDEEMRLLEHVQSYELLIPPGTLITYTIPPLLFDKPNLWWPNGMGKQYLYNVELSVDVKGFGESDSWSHQFGFRKIESIIDEATGGRLFKVNGQQIFIRGGNWILSDGLLRLSAKRYMTDIKFHADMNFNMIRCWGGGLAERPEFYHYCDVYGILVWQEFWITGDCDGRGMPISNPNGPLDHDLFLLCARDTVKLLRNHASLALWVGGNEQTPPKDINTALINDLMLHPLFKCSDETYNLAEESDDPSQYLDGTRAYVQGSMWDGFANGKGDFTDGPYEIQYPEDFFKDDFYQYGFNPEVGSVGIPVATTIRATMPPEGWQIPSFQKLSTGYIEEIPNPIWDYHKYIPYSNPEKVHDQIEAYGHPKDLDDFCEKAQLVNYVQYRALLEGWTSRMWTKYTGVLIWKTQNPWTGLRGQFYDHLHDQTAGFYGCRSAAEPIHVQLNLSTYYIEVVNTTSNELSDVAIEISVWDLDGACPYYKVTEKFSVAAKKVSPIVEMNYPKSTNAKPVYFLLLKLFRVSDSNIIISRNFYWLHLPDSDYNALELHHGKKVPLKITSHVSTTESTYNIQVEVHNASKNSNSAILGSLLNNHKNAGEKYDGGLQCSRPEISRIIEIEETDPGVAFFLHFSVHSANVEEAAVDSRILPVHYSDNYFSLVPGEELSINISFEVSEGITPKVLLAGWNYHEEIQVY
ncbi:mannosylglycoprotein endo-beta-mannosidase isoform X1 [Dendrobium catenatum]|uniref:Mannosylglycoprotein endo-beta-mannosidase n=3 Tax=Dendrobium catenatum TaxID=906689 RepID=A0A2I0VCN5_9ASPA|nr:mannosylglycoprotein endo-beta-mannosidase isoform X1 [Dendrobium catenatum]PKU61157.1 Mannosylglycoprotein endo-beta-mannosidase [Dendrobium catenatum]